MSQDVEETERLLKELIEIEKEQTEILKEINEAIQSVRGYSRTTEFIKTRSGY